MDLKIKIQHEDLTEGTIWKQLFWFALPLLGASLIQQLYNTVDLLFVGNLIGKEASAAIGSSSLLVTCLVGFFTGMSLGSGVISARFFGAGDKCNLKKTIETAIGISFIGGIVLTLIGWIGAPYFLNWMNTPEEILPSAIAYIRIYFISMVSVVTYNVGAGIIRALGDSRTPMYFQIIGGITNVIMDAVFIWNFRMGVEGAAWATLLSQTVSAVCVIFYLIHLDNEYKLKVVRIYKKLLLKILEVGVPAGIQAMIITLSNIFAQYYINGLGIDSIAAFTAYFKIELIIYLPIMAIGQAITIFTGQNNGAQKYSRIKKGVNVCITMGVIMTIFISTVLLVTGRQMFGFFNPDEAVIAYGIQIIGITFPFYFLYVFLEVLGDAIRGAGKAVVPMVIILFNMCAIRMIILYVVMHNMNEGRGIAMVYPITWATTCLCMFVYYKKGKWLKEGNANSL